MPQYSLYPAITELLEADLILVYKASVGAVKTITAENFAASIKALTDRSLEITNLSANATLTAEDDFVVCNSGGGFTVTLPLSADNPGLPFKITNKGAGSITIDTLGSDTIGGDASITLAQYESVTVIADGDAMWMPFGLAP